MINNSLNSSLGKGISDYRIRHFRKRLVEWFHFNGRPFPWRVSSNAYELLIAEVLLQKTDVAKVVSVYSEFIAAFPNTKTLEVASRQDIQHLISILGLQYKSRRLIDIARYIEERFAGQIPDNYRDLVSLPGIGPYIASAVLSTAYKLPKVAVDTNVIRVLCRYFGVQSTLGRPYTDRRLWDFAQKLLPRKPEDIGIWNYAVIDFAALVCKPYRPQCSQCILASSCITLRRQHHPLSSKHTA